MLGLDLDEFVLGGEEFALLDLELGDLLLEEVFDLVELVDFLLAGSDFVVELVLGDLLGFLEVDVGVLEGLVVVVELVEDLPRRGEMEERTSSSCSRPGGWPCRYWPGPAGTRAAGWRRSGC